MMTEQELLEQYRNYPHLLQQAHAVLEQCHIGFTLGTDKNKKTFTGRVEDDWDLLINRSWDGFIHRYDSSNAVMRERFNRELEIIRQKNFISYYLITYDIVQFARQRGFDYVGRGSGANSMIAYCLGITNVDPIELDLYFERFLNPERTSPPDFDIDFSWKDRDAITEYIFHKHGKDHVCLLGTHTTYQSRSILRELGKVFGLPKGEIDSLVDYPQQNRDRDHITQLIFNYAERMHEMPTNISIHAGGVLITEKPIHAYTATNLPLKGYPVSNFEMHSAEDIGIYKFDILSQRGLGHLKETVELVKKNKGVAVDVNRFDEFKKDEKIKDLISRGKTMGCFYVESPAMRMLLGKLRCEDYLTLVAASSIIRPGVARSGMMRAYIERFHLASEGKKYESIHPKMDELMAETFGVMVYQEDVIKVAHEFAGLSLTEADVLRRAMSGKFRSRDAFDAIRGNSLRSRLPEVPRRRAAAGCSAAPGPRRLRAPGEGGAAPGAGPGRVPQVAGSLRLPADRAAGAGLEGAEAGDPPRGVRRAALHRRSHLGDHRPAARRRPDHLHLAVRRSGRSRPPPGDPHLPRGAGDGEAEADQGAPAGASFGDLHRADRGPAHLARGRSLA